MRDSIFLAALLTSAIVAGMASARAARAAMRWALHGTLEMMLNGLR